MELRNFQRQILLRKVGRTLYGIHKTCITAIWIATTLTWKGCHKTQLTRSEKFASVQIQDPSQAKVFDSVVFEGPPVMEQKLWPAHAVQGTWGSELHKDLKVSA